jgi:hypothetical protein
LEIDNEDEDEHEHDESAGEGRAKLRLSRDFTWTSPDNVTSMIMLATIEDR